MPRKTKSSGNRAVVALMLVAALGVGGFAAYVKLNPAAQHVPSNLREATAPDRSDDNSTPPSRIRHTSAGPDVQITKTEEQGLRIPTIDTGDGLDVKLGESAPPIPDDQDARAFIATKTMEAAKINGAKTLRVTVKDRNATLDCTKEMEAGTGTNQEASLVKAMQIALGQFPEIDSFQFSVDGQFVEMEGPGDHPIPVIRSDGKEVKLGSTPPPAP